MENLSKRDCLIVSVGDSDCNRGEWGSPVFVGDTRMHVDGFFSKWGMRRDIYKAAREHDADIAVITDEGTICGYTCRKLCGFELYKKPKQ